MSKLRVRAYNVRFGDAILVSVPEKRGSREVTRTILIDVGNVLSGCGGEDSVIVERLWVVRACCQRSIKDCMSIRIPQCPRCVLPHALSTYGLPCDESVRSWGRPRQV